MSAEVIQVGREVFASKTRKPRGVDPAHIIILPVVRVERCWSNQCARALSMSDFEWMQEAINEPRRPRK